MAIVEIVEWGGRKWRRYPKSRHRHLRCYFTCHPTWKGPKLSLHREIWRAAHGDIPPGCDIHHVDENPLNNDISNLECVTVKGHRHRHRETYRKSERLHKHLQRIRPLAHAGLAEWNASEEGQKKLRENGRRVMESRPSVDFVCGHCGRAFKSTQTRAQFCSSRCRQREHPWQSKRKVVCGHCGEDFLAKKPKARFCSKTCSAFAREKAKRTCLQPDG